MNHQNEADAEEKKKMEWPWKKKLVMVSNRLPITVENTEGKVSDWPFRESSGGLAAVISSVREHFDFVWVGSAGIHIPLADRPAFGKRLKEEHNCIPVYLEPDIEDLHYNGFSNSVIWPLFHYMMDQIYFTRAFWDGYRTANQEFAKCLIQQFSVRFI